MGMNRIEQVLKYIKDPVFRFSIDTKRGRFDKLSDEDFVKKAFKLRMGYDLDLDNPQSFNEKLQWLKLYNRKPEYTRMVDKYEAKIIIEKSIGKEYIIPTYGVWNNTKEIDFSSLPNQFVIKCTHNSGGLIVCRDKKTLDIEAAKRKLQKTLEGNYYLYGREWPYKEVKPRIIAESLVQNSDDSSLAEYNFFCFNGEPIFFMHCYGDRDRGETRYNDYYMVDGTRLKLTWGYKSSARTEFQYFDAYEEMIEKARILSANIPFLRVDFYLCNGRPLMGELTFFHWGGFMPIVPKEFDKKFGEWIKLPINGNV
jgi:hypothetical protein